MINLKEIISNTNIVKNKLMTRGVDTSEIDVIFDLSKDRSSLMTKLQSYEASKNKISKEIGILKSKNENTDELFQEVASLKNKIEQINSKEKEVNEAINNKLLYIPNIPHDKVPLGKSEEDNILIKEHIIGRGKTPSIKTHYDFAIQKGWVDFERAVKISGSRFWIYKNQGAKLVRALQNFMLDEHINNGYEEIIPPLIVKSNTMIGTGQLPKFKDDAFKIEGLDSYLIPTAEVPLTNIYANEIIDLSSPKKLTAYTPCFRAEAGSGGKDMKGLIRAHQFNKVEVVKLVKKEDVEKEFKKTLNDCKAILEKLELPYQELMLCTGDLGFSSERTIDLEVWIPSENRYRETSSVSSFGDFQARRAKIRYKNSEGINQYAYTINGSGLAIDRVIASILEIYQNSDGTLDIPKVLIPYMKVGRI